MTIAYRSILLFLNIAVVFFMLALPVDANVLSSEPATSACIAHIYSSEGGACQAIQIFPDIFVTSSHCINEISEIEITCPGTALNLNEITLESELSIFQPGWKDGEYASDIAILKSEAFYPSDQFPNFANVEAFDCSYSMFSQEQGMYVELCIDQQQEDGLLKGKTANSKLCPGDSGSAIFDDDGNIVGLVSAIFSEDSGCGSLFVGPSTFSNISFINRFVSTLSDYRGGICGESCVNNPCKKGLVCSDEKQCVASNSETNSCEVPVGEFCSPEENISCTNGSLCSNNACTSQLSSIQSVTPQPAVSLTIILLLLVSLSAVILAKKSKAAEHFIYVLNAVGFMYVLLMLVVFGIRSAERISSASDYTKLISNQVLQKLESYQQISHSLTNESINTATTCDLFNKTVAGLDPSSYYPAIQSIMQVNTITAPNEKSSLPIEQLIAQCAYNKTDTTTLSAAESINVNTYEYEALVESRTTLTPVITPAVTLQTNLRGYTMVQVHPELNNMSTHIHFDRDYLGSELVRNIPKNDHTGITIYMGDENQGDTIYTNSHTKKGLTLEDSFSFGTAAINIRYVIEIPFPIHVIYILAFTTLLSIHLDFVTIFKKRTNRTTNSIQSL